MKIHFHFLIFLGLYQHAIVSLEIQDFERRSCSSGGYRNYKGTCLNIKNCPSAISNLRSGVKPPVCVTGDRNALICCREEPRVSLSMCQNYMTRAQNRNNNYVIPLLPTNRDSFVKGSNDLENTTAIPKLFVVGGSGASVDQFPHMVALGYRRNAKEKLIWQCGGTLISERHVLTAAHCLGLGTRKLTNVLLGDIHLDADANDKITSRQIVAVSNYTVHPSYNPRLKYHDIGIVTLANPVRFSSSIRPACLPPPEYRLELDRLVTVHGWGMVEFAGVSQPDTLQYATLTRIPQGECNDIYSEESDAKSSYPEGILLSQLCAGDDTKDSCKGDSGGGLVIRRSVEDIAESAYFVVGITSFGTRYCGTGTPGIYTNVQAYLNWLESIVWP